jgi:uncharacterized protein
MLKKPVQIFQRAQDRGVKIDETLELPDLPKRHDHLLSINQVRFKGSGKWHNGLIRIHGQISGNYTLSCARCLAKLSVDFSEPLEELFNVEATRTSLEMLDEEERDEMHEVEGNVIDLQPYIEQKIIVTIPFAPACHSPEKCAQNLPQEGKDWSIISEQEQKQKQEQPKVDPRLAKLAEFNREDDALS